MDQTTTVRADTDAPSHGVSWGEAFWTWARVTALSFGSRAACCAAGVILHLVGRV